MLMKKLYLYFLNILFKELLASEASQPAAKLLDYQDFYNVANLMNKKTHLTDLGLNKIRLIKQGMNRNRI
jgi:hypothetical protein